MGTTEASPSESPLLRGIALLAAKELPAALEAASDACRADPGRPEAHYLYGQTLTALGNHALAERAFAEALRLRPGWADAWVHYGVARYRQGVVGDAETAMRQALRHDPEHVSAAANLAAFLRINGGPEDAADLLRRRLDQHPGDVGARLNLVADLLQEGRSDEALALLDAAEAPTEPATARHWYLQRSLALLRLGRTAEGRAALDDLDAMGPTSPALAPLRLWRAVLVARAEGDFPGAAAAAEAMASALDRMGPEAVPEHRIMGHYDLAKFWAGRGEHARAFAHWREGHRLLAPSQPFSRDAHRALVEANVAAFPPERLATGPRATNRDPSPVFIVGMPRSGTTLCERILSAHRDVHGAGERTALSKAFDVLTGGGTPEGVARLATLDEATLDRAAARYLAELRALAPDKARVVDKMPGNYLHLGLVGLMLPEARVIHCTRDPRDIGLSIFTFRFFGGHGYAHDLADLGWTIAQQTALMDHWKSVLRDRVLTVALSDWVNDFDATLERVLEFLGLSPDPNCARFHELRAPVHTVSRDQVRQPINARGLGRWRTYEAELTPLIGELRRHGLLPEASPGVSEPSGGPATTGVVPLSIVTSRNPAQALGLAVVYLRAKPAFADLSFGAWSSVLIGQINRGHYRFVADSGGKVVGFLGYAVTSREAAEAWVSGQRDLDDADCRGGDTIVVNAYAADTSSAHRFLFDELRRIMVGSTALVFKRRYRDGRIRPGRVATTDFVISHLTRASGILPSSVRSSDQDVGAAASDDPFASTTSSTQ